MLLSQWDRKTPRRPAFEVPAPFRRLHALLRSWPGRLVARVVDLLDERIARRRREEFGRRGWLLSWQREPDGRWKARLSGPEAVHTIERTATTRSRAIARSARAMTRLRSIRARLGARTTPDPTIGRTP